MRKINDCVFKLSAIALFLVFFASIGNAQSYHNDLIKRVSTGGDFIPVKAGASFEAHILSPDKTKHSFIAKLLGIGGLAAVSYQAKFAESKLVTARSRPYLLPGIGLEVGAAATEFITAKRSSQYLNYVLYDRDTVPVGSGRMKANKFLGGSIKRDGFLRLYASKNKTITDAPIAVTVAPGSTGGGFVTNLMPGPPEEDPGNGGFTGFGGGWEYYFGGGMPPYMSGPSGGGGSGGTGYTPPIDSLATIVDTGLRSNPCHAMDFYRIKHANNNISTLLKMMVADPTTTAINISEGPLPAYNNEDAHTRVSKSGDYLTIYIKLNADRLTNCTQEYIVETIMHEILHAYYDYSHPGPEVDETTQHEAMILQVSKEITALRSMFPTLSNHDAACIILGGYGDLGNAGASAADQALFAKACSDNSVTAQDVQTTNFEYRHGAAGVGTPCPDI